MDTRQAYNLWAEQYDTNKNRTRDREAEALRAMLEGQSFASCLEVGCGTGKNTIWLAQKAKNLLAVDFSEKMLVQAKKKLSSSPHVSFAQADISGPWSFADGFYDLITFSLVLEHIDDLTFVFGEAAKVLKNGGSIYVGELHPFKQYQGTKARFDLGGERHVLTCFDHHVSDFVQAGRAAGLELTDLKEVFDAEEGRAGLPRVLTLLFRKP